MANSYFDAKNSRLNYADLLMPGADIGAALGFAVGFTYSLDLEALTGAEIALGMAEEPDSGRTANPFFALEAMRRCSEKLAIFCNAGSIQLPRNLTPLYALQDECVFEVNRGSNRSFHPKLWFVQYSNEDGGKTIRLSVLSRNLTFDRSLDLAVSMSASVGRRVNPSHKPLYDMLLDVNSLAGPKKSKKIRALAENMLHAEAFELDDPFESYAFLPSGISGTHQSMANELKDADRLFIVSPFLDEKTVKALTHPGVKQKSLLTRKESLTPSIFRRFDKVYVTKDRVLSDAILEDADDGSSRDIHAKLFFKHCMESGHAANYLYIGSQNATDRAFSRNTEFMLRLKYKNSRISYSAFVDSFVPNSPESPFEALESFTDADVTGRVQEEDLHDAVTALKSAAISENGDAYCVTITADAERLEKPVFIRPLLLLNAEVQLSGNTVFEGVPLRCLSCFYVLRRGNVQIVTRCRTKGIPENRNDAVYNEIINNPRSLFAYVSMMLTGDDSFNLEQADDLLARSELQPEQMESASYMPVYEQMLKVAASNPQRILDLEGVLECLEDGVVPDTFRETFQAFKQVAKRRTKA